jgi:hypothetical protein
VSLTTKLHVGFVLKNRALRWKARVKSEKNNTFLFTKPIDGGGSKMPPKLPPALPYLILLSFLFFYIYSTSLLPHSTTTTTTKTKTTSCNLFKGNWVLDRTKSTKPLYDESCPFHRNAWNCLRNQRENMGLINSWRWVPKDCELPKIDPERFLELMRNRNIGLVGDSLNENFLVSFLCILRVADGSAKKWKRKGAWRGAYFPKFNVTVAYHRAVLLSKYE